MLYYIRKKLLNFTEHIRNIKIQTRLLCSFLILSLVPLLITSIISYAKYSKSIESKIGTYSDQVMNELSKEINMRVNSVQNMCNEMMLYDPLQYGLTNYESLNDIQKSDVVMQVNDYFHSKLSIASYITDFEIITNDNNLFYSSGYCYLSSDDTNKIIKGINDNNGINWSYIYLKGRRNVVLGQVINSVQLKGQVGYMIMIVDESYFSNEYRDVNIGNGAKIFVSRPDGMVISTRNNDIEIGKIYNQKSVLKNITENKETHKNAFPLTINNKKYLISYSYISDADSFIISMIPYSYFNSETSGIKMNLIFIVIVCFVFSILFAYVISRSISAPLNRIVNLMKQAETGNLEINLKNNKSDEIGYLEDNFNNMLAELRKLIGQVKEEQKNKREAEFQALQAQINPHFLFNTLNSLRWVAMMSQATSVCKGIDALAKLLRSTIIDKKELVTIEEEIDNVKNYAIIQIKYGDSFNVEYSIGEEFLKYKILKFILQPVVENSIIHGNEDEQQDNINIVLSCEKSGNDLYLMIKDNGKGMSGEKVKQLLSENYKSKKQFSGVGIINVNNRIKLNFGDKYGIDIKSKEGAGTEVIMKLPLILSQEVDQDV